MSPLEIGTSTNSLFRSFEFYFGKRQATSPSLPLARLGAARHGDAGRGMARQGGAWQGKARQGKDFIK